MLNDIIIYEHSAREFGDYTFEVCAFDETAMNTKFSTPVTVSYEPSPTVAMPANVQLDADNPCITWDEVEGAARYNIRIYQDDDDDRTFYTSDYTNGSAWWYYLDGSYWFSVQAMDGDYHVSDWTEPLLFTYTTTPKPRLDTPQNVHVDESGENIVWDAVEGADYYEVDTRFGSYIRCEQPILENWKIYSSPCSDGKQAIDVIAYSSNSNIENSNWSDILNLDYTPIRDESIVVPAIQVGNESITWDATAAENVKKNAYRLLVNGEPINDEYNVYDIYDNDTYSFWIGNHLPAGDYEFELYVVDE